MDKQTEEFYRDFIMVSRWAILLDETKEVINNFLLAFACAGLIAIGHLDFLFEEEEYDEEATKTSQIAKKTTEDKRSYARKA